MGLPESINTLNSWANECRIRLWAVEDDLDWRAISQYNLSQHGGIGYVATANREVLANLIEAMQWFVYGYASSFSYFVWFSVHNGLYEQEAAITWETICEAWVKNDFEGKEWTIACIDRMRTLMWDEPFYVQWSADPDATRVEWE